MRLFIIITSSIVAAVIILMTMAATAVEYQKQQEHAQMCKALGAETFLGILNNCPSPKKVEPVRPVWTPEPVKPPTKPIEATHTCTEKAGLKVCELKK